MTSEEAHRLHFHTWLIENGLRRESADAILGSMPPYDWHQLAMKADLEPLATKAALAEFRTATDARFSVLEATTTGLQRQISGLRTEVGELRTDMANQIGSLRTEFGSLRTEFGSLRTEFGSLRTDMNAQMDNLRTEFRELRTDLNAQISGLRGEVRLVLLTLVGFILTVVLTAGAVAVTALLS